MIQVLGWVALGSIAVTLLQLLRRYAVKDGRMPVSRFLFSAFTATAIGFVVLYVSFWGFTLPTHLSVGFYRVVLMGALANVAIQGLNAKSMSYPLGEVSYTAPLAAMTPMLLTLTAALTGEFPGVRGWCGVVVMMAGSYLLAFAKPPEKLWHYASPFLRAIALFKASTDEAERQKAVVTMLALGSAFLGTIGLLCDGLMVRRAGDMQGIIFGSLIIVTILALGYAPFALRPIPGKSGSREERVLVGLTVSAAFAGLWVAHILLIQPQFDHALIAYVGTLKRFSVLFTILAGAWVFREQDFKKRLLAGSLVVAGAILIAMDPAPVHLSARLTEFGL